MNAPLFSISGTSEPTDEDPGEITLEVKQQQHSGGHVSGISLHRSTIF